MSSERLESRIDELLGFAGTQQRHSEALAKATGQDFNIFKILGVGHLEVKTHSPMLVELLNPRGRHGQGSVFLQLFVDQFKIDSIDTQQAIVKAEHHVGGKTSETGGRIDIVISDRQSSEIFIENKIYAGDQENQMMRYRNANLKAHLFYLTLDGRPPTNENDIPGLTCISYATDILDWLADCRRKVAEIPVVREAISQYIALIRDLTHQNINTSMSQEITKKALQDKDTYSAFVALCRTQRMVRKAILMGLNKKLEGVAKSLGLDLVEKVPGDGKRCERWSFASAALAARNLKIGFEFDAKNYQYFFFGFHVVDLTSDDPDVTRSREEFHKKLRHEFESEFENRLPETPGYPAHFWWQQHPHWNHETFESIHFGSVDLDFKAQLERLLMAFEKACSADEK